MFAVTVDIKKREKEMVKHGQIKGTGGGRK
jgi:hypothetical protein